MEAILVATIDLGIGLVLNQGEVVSVDDEVNIGFKDNIYFDLYPNEYILIH